MHRILRVPWACVGREEEAGGGERTADHVSMAGHVCVECGWRDPYPAPTGGRTPGRPAGQPITPPAWPVHSGMGRVPAIPPRTLRRAAHSARHHHHRHHHAAARRPAAPATPGLTRPHLSAWPAHVGRAPPCQTCASPHTARPLTAASSCGAASTHPLAPAPRGRRTAW